MRPSALHDGEPVTVLRVQRRPHRIGIGRDGDPALIPAWITCWEEDQQEAVVHQGSFDVRPQHGHPIRTADHRARLAVVLAAVPDRDLHRTRVAPRREPGATGHQQRPRLPLAGDRSVLLSPAARIDG